MSNRNLVDHLQQIFLSGLALVLLSSPATAHSSAGPTWDSSITAAATELVFAKVSLKPGSREVVPRGISVAVGMNGALLYAIGMGEARDGTPATPETVYRIGSISKQFTAAAVLNLIDAGARAPTGGELIRFDTPIAQVIDEATAWSEPDRPPITLRSLLTMTSSLPNFTRRPPSKLDPWGAAPAQQLRAALAELKRSGFPGSFEYSNTGYFFLSEAVRIAGSNRTEDAYGEILRRLTIAKANLENTGVAVEASLQSRLATPHYNRRPAFGKPDWLQGSGDLASTALDLFKWNTSLMQGNVLGTSMRQEMFSDCARVDVWTYYGMGWFISHKEGRDDFFHSGAVPGYTGFNMISRTQIGDWYSISVLTNSDGVEGLDQLAEGLLDLAISRLR